MRGVPAVGFEPTSPVGQQFLRLPRIPFRHAGLRIRGTHAVYSSRAATVKRGGAGNEGAF